MADVVVTVPMRLWDDWVAEGDIPGDPPTGESWGFYTGGHCPKMARGERVYVVAHGRLRGYAPLTDLIFNRVEVEDNEPMAGRGEVIFCREAGAVAITIDAPIIGFQGWRYRWWDRADERPFPGWRVP